MYFRTHKIFHNYPSFLNPWMAQVVEKLFVKDKDQSILQSISSWWHHMADIWVNIGLDHSLSSKPLLIGPWKISIKIFRCLIFQLISVIDGWGISCELALRWMSLNLTDDKSTLVKVMAWCHQATSHYLRRCWPRSLSTYGITRPQRVKIQKFSHHENVLENVFCNMSAISFMPESVQAPTGLSQGGLLAAWLFQTKCPPQDHTNI